MCTLRFRKLRLYIEKQSKVGSTSEQLVSIRRISMIRTQTKATEFSIPPLSWSSTKKASLKFSSIRALEARQQHRLEPGRRSQMIVLLGSFLFSGSTHKGARYLVPPRAFFLFALWPIFRSSVSRGCRTLHSYKFRFLLGLPFFLIYRLDRRTVFAAQGGIFFVSPSHPSVFKPISAILLPFSKSFAA